MDDQEFLPAEDSKSDAKTDVARGIAKAGETPQEDPSLATLHYGENARPELGGTGSAQATSTSGVRVLFDSETPAPDVAPPTAGAEAPQFATRAQSTPVTPGEDTPRTTEPPDPQGIETDKPVSPPLDFDQPPSSGPITAGQTERNTSNDAQQPDGPTNAAPTEVRLDGVEVTENADGVAIGRLTVVDGNSDDTHSFVLSDDRFEIVDGKVRLRPGVTLDHEKAATIELEVTATDSGGLSVTQSFEIKVLDVNEGPTDVAFEGETIAENASSAFVGRLTAVDPDAGDTHSFSVSDDRFEVVDGEVRLKLGVSLDFEDASTIFIEVTATDSGGLTITETFDVQVSDVNEGPESVSLDASPVAENQEGTVVGRVSAVDPDAGDTHTFTASDDRFEVVDGEVRLKPGIALDHEDAGSISLEVTAVDSGGLSVSETFEVVVADVNEGPTSVSLDT